VRAKKTKQRANGFPE